MPAVPLRRITLRGHLVVCGDTALAHRLAEALVTRFGQEVTVILPSKRQHHGPQISRLPKVRIVEAQQLTDEAFLTARVDMARAVALVGPDDVGNIHAALRAQEINSRLRLVIRMSNTVLGHRIRKLFADCAVLSDAGMAAPEFVAAAFGQVAPNHVRIGGRTVYVTERGAGDQHVLCGLADDPAADTPLLLPPGKQGAGLVLALADGTPRDPVAQYRRRRLPLAGLLGNLHSVVNRWLRLAIAVLVALLIVGVGLQATVGGYSLLDSIYLTLFEVSGTADPDIGLPAVAKLTQLLVTLSGIALIPVITATIVDSIVRIRLADSRGRLLAPISDHVVVVGLGEVGTRIARQLHDLGIPVVCIEHDENAAGVAQTRGLGVPIVFGDATREETLRTAWVGNSRALVTVTSDDITNLEAALHGRTFREDLHVVLRLFDGDLAIRVQRNFNIPVSRSVPQLAAPAFAAAMTERKIIGTIPIGQQVIFIADVPIEAGSTLAGRPVRDVHEPGEARAVAMARRGEHDLDWSLDEDYCLAPEDRLIILTTRSGLGRVLTKAGSPYPA
ncbi:MAG TPA: NAD-binding protein [Streptosporangiaceae bacterium]|nr:NAD-binding protein [Streptosporangiaceae bacterium]